MDFNKTESARVAQASDELMGKLTDGVEKALSEDAGRGFPMPSGDTLAAILAAGQEAKGKLADANGKIYAERRQVIFQEQEFDLKVLVRIAKLALELYKATIFNALSLEQAQAQAVTERKGADVQRLNAETEFRQVAIIRARAEIEQTIIPIRQQLVDAQTVTLGAESTLIDAQLQTAEKKLEIINSIYQVLAAEQLVLTAERRRADALQQVLVAHQDLALVKEQMIPFYLQKADAVEQLAAARKAELPIREALERLGYDRIALKDAEEAANHLERQAQENYELAQESLVRARTSTELAKTQSRRILQTYANQVQTNILTMKKELEEMNINFKLNTALAREAIGVNNDIAVIDHDRSNLTKEIQSLVNNMALRASSEAGAITASATRNEYSNTYSDLFRTIISN